MKFEGKLKTHAFVEKYLAVKLDQPLGNTWELTERSLWGTIIFQMMNTPIILANPYKYTLDDFAAEIRIRIHTKRIQYNMYNWSITHSVKLTRFVRNQINDELFIIIESNNKRRGDIKRLIYAFMDYYNITEDNLPYETLQKAYFRAKKRQNKSIKLLTQLSGKTG